MLLLPFKKNYKKKKKNNKKEEEDEVEGEGGETINEGERGKDNGSTDLLHQRTTSHSFPFTSNLFFLPFCFFNSTKFVLAQIFIN